jgi:hypothetical protein
LTAKLRHAPALPFAAGIDLAQPGKTLYGVTPMRDILIKFIVALLVFAVIIWWGMKHQQDEISHLPDAAAALSQSSH